MYKYKVKWNDGTAEKTKEFEDKKVAEFFINTLPTSSSPVLTEVYERETKEIVKGYEITIQKFEFKPFEVSSKDLDNFPLPTEKRLDENGEVIMKTHKKYLGELFDFFRNKKGL